MSEGLPREIEAVVAFGGLALTLPVIALSSIAIKLSSPGSVLFRQQRIGRGGRPFTLYKFRTMRPHSGGAAFTAADDDRITRIGRVLRNSKLDELPTLWNVVVGEMGLVGPRPEVPRYVDLEDPIWKRVLSARPGLTSPMAIELRDEEAVLERVAGDRETFYREALLPYKLLSHRDYLEKRTWSSDVGVLVKTVWAVVRSSREPPPSPKEIERYVRGQRG